MRAGEAISPGGRSRPARTCAFGGIRHIRRNVVAVEQMNGEEADLRDAVPPRRRRLETVTSPNPQALDLRRAEIGLEPQAVNRVRIISMP